MWMDLHISEIKIISPFKFIRYFDVYGPNQDKKDLVRANILTSEGGGSGVYNIASGTRTCLNELSQHVKEIARSKVEPVYSQARAGDIRDSVADISLAENLGYSPKYTVEEGLRDAIRWYSKLS